jgi:hypothetical protein
MGVCGCQKTDISADVTFEWVGHPGAPGDSIELPFIDYATVASSWIMSKVFDCWFYFSSHLNSNQMRSLPRNFPSDGSMSDEGVTRDLHEIMQVRTSLPEKHYFLLTPFELQVLFRIAFHIYFKHSDIIDTPLGLSASQYIPSPSLEESFHANPKEMTVIQAAELGLCDTVDWYLRHGDETDFHQVDAALHIACQSNQFGILSLFLN